VEVDIENRTINCAKCDIVMDAFEYMKDVCFRDEHAFTQYVTLQMEVEKMKRQYNNLIKDISRLKKLRNELKS